ncbi:MAG: hypothetical protein ACOYMB_03085 [Patescibacteria group bacterium]
MFNDLNNSPQGGAKEIDDIFSDVDQPAAPAPSMPSAPSMPAPFPPSAPQGSPISQTPPPTAQPAFPSSGKEAFLRIEDNMPAAGERGAKALKIFLILLIVVAALSFAGYFIYAKFIQPKMQVVSDINSYPIQTPSAADQAAAEKNIKDQEANNQVAPIVVVPEIIPDNATTSIPTISTSSASSTIGMTGGIDTDSDGLSDQEEILLGTDINKVDSDGDGLSDYEEVKTYLTNPLLSDTDGDGYSDGAEVKSGYNPNGAGKMPVATPLK